MVDHDSVIVFSQTEYESNGCFLTNNPAVDHGSVIGIRNKQQTVSFPRKIMPTTTTKFKMNSAHNFSNLQDGNQ